MATYYFDFDYGNNTNTVGNPASPLKDLPGTSTASDNAAFNPNAGDILLLANGSTWETDAWVFGGNDDGALGNPVVISNYDNTTSRVAGLDNPIVSNFKVFIDTDWTYHGSAQVWYASLPTSTTSVLRTFFEYVGQTSGATSAVTCTASLPWWFDSGNNRLYVYSTSAGTTQGVDDPSTIYGDVRCTYRNTLGQYNLDVRSCSYLDFSNITFRGADLACIRVNNNVLSSDCGGINITNCSVEYFGQHGISFSTSVAQDLVGTNNITGNTIDRKHSALENIASGHGGDGVNISGGVVSNVIIDGNTLIDCPHSAINMTTIVSTRPVSGVIVRNNYITAPVTNYGRAIGINGVSGTLNNIYIYNNYAYDVPVQTQIEGKDIYFYNNIIDKTRGTSLASNAGNGISVNARDTAEVDNVNILNNTIINSEHTGIYVGDSSGYPITSCNVKNNIVHQVPANTDQDCFQYSEVDTQGILNISNNLFYSETTLNTVDWDSTVYTVAAADAARSEMSDNLSNDPGLDVNYIPNMNSTVANSGATITWSDFDAYTRPNTTNNYIGAVAPNIETSKVRRKL